MVAGHIQPKKGFFYIVLNLYEQGSRKTKWIATGLPVKGNKRRAEAMLLEARKAYTCEEVLENKSKDGEMLFTDYMSYWLQNIKNQVEISTYSAYHRVVENNIIPYFKELELKLCEIRSKHIQDYYNFLLNDKGLSGNTVLHHHANLKKSLSYAVKMEFIENNPMDKVERPRTMDHVGAFYSSDELQILFEVVKGNILEFAVHMASFYGLRRSEICGLKWCNIDFDKNTISISHTVITASVDGKYTMFFKDRAKNKKSRRTLPLVPQYRETLLMMKEQQNKNRDLGGSTYNTDFLEYIYVDALGKLVNPDRITHRFRMLFNEHPELRRIRFHDLRHSCASLLLNNGVEMKNIQEWLGHSSYNTTANIYTHLKSDSKIEAANIMSSVLQK